MNQLEKHLGRVIAAVRSYYNVTREGLAEQTQLPLSQIVQIERGSLVPLIYQLVRICAVLDVTVGFVVVCAEQEQPNAFVLSHLARDTVARKVTGFLVN